MAIIEHESSGQADVENGGCKGLMQIYENITETGWNVLE